VETARAAHATAPPPSPAAGEAGAPPARPGAAAAAARLPSWLSGPSAFARHAEAFFPAVVGLLLNPSGAGAGAVGSSVTPDGAGASMQHGGGPPAGAPARGGGGGGGPGVLHYLWRDAALVMLRWERLYERNGGRLAGTGAGAAPVRGAVWRRDRARC
jgi:hypothetical protein